MKKYFCDKCLKEIKPNDANVIEGFVYLNDRQRIKIKVEMDLDSDRYNICRDCQMDAIISMDYRPRTRVTFAEVNKELDDMDGEDEEEGGDDDMFVKPPSKKPLPKKRS